MAKEAPVSTAAVNRIVLRGVAPAQPAQTEPAQTEPTQTEPAQTEPAQTEPATPATPNSGLTSDAVYESGYVTGSDGVARHYYAYLDVQATVYNAGGYTAYGLPADENVMGVGLYEGTLTPVIPFGTVCYVKGDYADIGVRIASDCGYMYGNKIDICMYPTNPLYYNFGWRSMRVYFLD